MNSEALRENIICPTWSVNERIQALSTTRNGGVSQSPWNTFNLATHVNDDLNDVLQNRSILKQSYNLPKEPTWLTQTHSNNIIRLTADNLQQLFNADAAYTTEKNIICCVMTADCLPILLCNEQATWVAAIHAGWKGIANGIIRKLVSLYKNEIGGEVSDLHVWVGPAISEKVYEVGADVKEAFVQQDSALKKAFKETHNNKYLLNSVKAARLQLMLCGINEKSISSPSFCTYQEHERFFSYRRDGVNSGRMASMVWLAEP